MRGMASRISAPIPCAPSPQRIAAQTRGSAQQVAIQSVASTGSTNADLLAAIDQLRRPTLLVAASQSAGRGRAGRPWQSAPDASLTFSLAWRFKRPLHQLIGLPLAVGVALAEALAAFSLPVQLKWPNDILRGGKKVGGVLIETAAPKHPQPDLTWVVIGVGLNLRLPPAMAAEIGQPAAALPELVRVERELLLAELLSALADTLLQFEAHGFAVFCERWNQLHAYAGQAVAILDQGGVAQHGVALRVDANGCLLLQTASGLVPVLAGDVSLRLQGA